MKCSHIMSYDEILHLRELTTDEMLDVAGDPRILEIIKKLAMAKKEYEAKHGVGSWMRERK
jgi:hypothetical protein